MGFLPSLLYALLMGAIPLVEVIWRGRSPAATVTARNGLLIAASRPQKTLCG